MTLPQIPKSDWYKNVEGLIQVAYTKQQLTEYGQTCYQAGRDSMKAECVKVCEDIANKYNCMEEADARIAGQWCRDAIKELK